LAHLLAARSNAIPKQAKEPINPTHRQRNKIDTNNER